MHSLPSPGVILKALTCEVLSQDLGGENGMLVCLLTPGLYKPVAPPLRSQPWNLGLLH